VAITYIGSRSRFPPVILTGSFVCNACPVPPEGSHQGARHGRYVDVSPQTHTWRVFVRNDGWNVRVVSSGDPLPQLVP
jgi:hypothetical protein